MSGLTQTEEERVVAQLKRSFGDQSVFVRKSYPQGTGVDAFELDIEKPGVQEDQVFGSIRNAFPGASIPRGVRVQFQGGHLRLG